MLKRLDHLICEVPDIRAAMRWFVVERGYPEAWPIGPFWPNALTSGVALGGINLEFLKPESGAPANPSIRTLVFEPVDMDAAIAYYEELRFPMTLKVKMESDPALLRLRGFTEKEAQTPQLICRNLVPDRPGAIDFFLCEYSPALKRRLGASAFPELPAVTRVTVDLPADAKWDVRLFPLAEDAAIEIGYRPVREGSPAHVSGIKTVSGPIWP